MFRFVFYIRRLAIGLDRSEASDHVPALAKRPKFITVLCVRRNCRRSPTGIAWPRRISPKTPTTKRRPSGTVFTYPVAHLSTKPGRIVSPLDDWTNLKEVTKLAVTQLLDELKSETSTDDLLDSYLYAKRLLAESMQALIRVGLTEPNDTFSNLRKQVQAEINSRYAGQIPDRYLKVPYGSRAHKELFAILLQRQGTPVQAALLRVVTGDSVHTERRLRELRELGLDVQNSKESGYDYYTLGSLNIDTSFVPSIVANRIKKARGLPAAQKQTLLRQVNTG